MKRAAVVALVCLAACMSEEDQMALPLSANTVYAPGSQVKSADLNDVQGCIVAGKHGPITRVIPGASGHEGNAWSGSWISFVARKQASADGPTFLLIPLVVATGERITATVTLEYATGVPALAGNAVTLVREDGTGAQTTVGTQPIPNTSGPQTITIVTAHDVVAGNSYVVVVDMGFRDSTGNKIVYNVTLTVSHL